MGQKAVNVILNNKILIHICAISTAFTLIAYTISDSKLFISVIHLFMGGGGVCSMLACIMLANITLRKILEYYFFLPKLTPLYLAEDFFILNGLGHS